MSGIILDDYQEEAVKKMKNGCILRGGVGSGKSRTAIAYYYVCNDGVIGSSNYEPMGDPPQDLYVITTARKRDSLEWEGEMCPFLLSPNRENSLYCNRVVIDSWNNISKYKDVTDSFFIFDEQRLVGNGAWVKSFYSIAKNNKWILLTATPGDTWSDYIPVFVANGFYKNKTEFSREHIVYNRSYKFSKIDRYLNTGKLIRLRNSILVDMDYESINKAHYENVLVSYDSDKYKEVSKKRWNPYENKPIENAGELSFVLRKIVNSDDSRLVKVLEIFEKHPKVIIFYNFDYELELLKNLGYGEDVEVSQLNGHKHDPTPIGDKWVYLVHYTSGCEGWNCVTTDTIIFYSQNYSYRVMTQAAGRTDRRNTPYKDLYYYNLKSKSGIDLAINHALNNKKDFNIRSYIKW